MLITQLSIDFDIRSTFRDTQNKQSTLILGQDKQNLNELTSLFESQGKVAQSVFLGQQYNQDVDGVEIGINNREDYTALFDHLINPDISSVVFCAISGVGDVKGSETSLPQAVETNTLSLLYLIQVFLAYQQQNGQI